MTALERSAPFTPNSTPQAERPCARLITISPNGKPWHYSGCEQHMREFVTASREVGDTLPYWLFDANPGGYCAVCWAFTEGRPDPGRYMHNQLPRELLA